MNTLFIIIGLIGGLLVAISIAGYRYYSGLRIKSQFDVAVEERNKISTKMDSLNKAAIKEINNKKDFIISELDDSFDNLNSQINTKTELLKDQNDKLLLANKKVDKNIKNIEKINSISKDYLEKINIEISGNAQTKKLTDRIQYENLKSDFFNLLEIFIDKEHFLKIENERKIKVVTKMNEITNEFMKHPYVYSNSELRGKLRDLDLLFLKRYLSFLNSEKKDRETVSLKIANDDGIIEIANGEKEYESYMFDIFKELDVFESIQNSPFRQAKKLEKKK